MLLSLYLSLSLSLSPSLSPLSLSFSRSRSPAFSLSPALAFGAMAETDLTSDMGTQGECGVIAPIAHRPLEAALTPSKEHRLTCARPMYRWPVQV